MTAKNYYHVNTEDRDEMQAAINEITEQVKISQRYLVKWEKARYPRDFDTAFTAIRDRYYQKLAVDLAEEMFENGTEGELYALEMGSPNMAAKYLVYIEAGISLKLGNGFFEVTE